MNPQEEKEVLLKVAKVVAKTMKKEGKPVSVSTTIDVMNDLKKNNPDLHALVERMKAERVSDDTFKFHRIPTMLQDPAKLIDDPTNPEIIWKATCQKVEKAVTLLAAVLSGKKQLRLTSYYGGTKIPNAVYFEEIGEAYSGPEGLKSIVTKSSRTKTFATMFNNIASWVRHVSINGPNPENQSQLILYIRNPRDLDRSIGS